MGWGYTTLSGWEAARDDNKVPLYALYAYAGFTGTRVPQGLLTPQRRPANRSKEDDAAAKERAEGLLGAHLAEKAKTQERHRKIEGG